MKKVLYLFLLIPVLIKTSDEETRYAWRALLAPKQGSVIKGEPVGIELSMLPCEVLDAEVKTAMIDFFTANNLETVALELLHILEKTQKIERTEDGDKQWYFVQQPLLTDAQETMLVVTIVQHKNLKNFEDNLYKSARRTWFIQQAFKEQSHLFFTDVINHRLHWYYRQTAGNSLAVLGKK